MREIEFRGKDINQREWVYGFYSPRIAYPTLEQTPSIKSFKNSDFEVDKNTIGQYTGLKDKNGKKIFEGDIVENSLGDKFIVDLSFEDNVDLFPTCRCVLPNISCREVVGNIYDNPELLKGE